MMIKLKKLGTTLVSRQSGKDAFSVFQKSLKLLPESEDVIVDFTGVITFSHGWGDEFITVLHKRYGDRLILKNTNNLSVKATLNFLEETDKKKFRKID